MDYEIKDVITEDVELIEMIVERYRKVCYETCGTIVPDIGKIIDMPYGKIFDYGKLIV